MKCIIYRFNKIIENGRKVIYVVLISLFALFFCVLFFIFEIIWSLADNIIRKLENGGYL